MQHTCTHIHAHTHVHTCMGARAHTRARAHVHTYTRTCEHVHKHRMHCQRVHLSHMAGSMCICVHKPVQVCILIHTRRSILRTALVSYSRGCCTGLHANCCSAATTSASPHSSGAYTSVQLRIRACTCVCRHASACLNACISKYGRTWVSVHGCSHTLGQSCFGVARSASICGGVLLTAHDDYGPTAARAARTRVL